MSIDDNRFSLAKDDLNHYLFEIAKEIKKRVHSPINVELVIVGG